MKRSPISDDFEGEVQPSGAAARLEEQYNKAFLLEAAKQYPPIDGIEAAFGFRLDRVKMENAARVLACPVKVNPPNWQHGRVLYAAARFYLYSLAAKRPGMPLSEMPGVTFLDIGTAKGFSALCARWAVDDSGIAGEVFSCDVIDPKGKVKRNTVAECNGERTLAEILKPWAADASRITFLKSTGVDWLMQRQSRVNFAFIDGKHTQDQVGNELALLANRQLKGDMVVCDDLQYPGVRQAVWDLSRETAPYSVQIVTTERIPKFPRMWNKELIANRAYAILTHR